MASAMMTTNMDISMEIHSRSVVCMAEVEKKEGVMQFPNTDTGRVK